MMCTVHTAPAEAYAPDADQDASDAPRRPGWAACMVALLILLLVASILSLHPRRSAQGSSARNATRLGEAVARACRALGLVPDDSQLAQLTRAVAAFFDDENHGSTRIHTNSPRRRATSSSRWRHAPRPAATTSVYIRVHPWLHFSSPAAQPRARPPPSLIPPLRLTQRGRTTASPAILIRANPIPPLAVSRLPAAAPAGSDRGAASQGSAAPASPPPTNRRDPHAARSCTPTKRRCAGLPASRESVWPL